MKEIHNKYKHLLNDDTFVSWLTGQENKKWEDWKKSNEEHSAFVKFVSEFLKNLKPTEQNLSDLEKKQLWDGISNRISDRPKTKTLSLRVWLHSAAAAILLLISLGVYHLNNIEVTSLSAQHIKHYLPDSSLVELNAGSKITYNKIMWRIKRDVEMKGEAYFKVKKGEKFSVKANDIKISVLGTSFNVYARTEESRVECFTGKVKVHFAQQKKPNILTKGMGVKKVNNKINAFTHYTHKKPSWITGEFHFNNASYLKVFNELERQFNIRIPNKERFADKTYTGYFINSDLETAFEMTLTSISCSYTKEADNYKIVKK